MLPIICLILILNSLLLYLPAAVFGYGVNVNIELTHQQTLSYEEKGIARLKYWAADL